MGTLDIIIVNWNAGSLLRECLRSVDAAAPSAARIQRLVVVDNNSSDGSADDLPELQIPVTVIRNPENRGFAAACNQGGVGSRADYLLFLNPDTVLLPSSLEVPIRFLDDPSNAAVGIVGIQLLDSNDRVQPTCARFPTPIRFIGHMFGLDRVAPRWVTPHFMKEWDHEDTRVVDQVMGAFFMTRRSLFESLGGFDERFFVYVEEVDFSRRALLSGSKTVHLSNAAAYHSGGGTTNGIPARRLFYNLRSRILYFFKHHHRLPVILYVFSVFVFEFPARLVHSLFSGSVSSSRAILRAGVSLAMDLPGILRTALTSRTSVNAGIRTT